MGICRSSRNAVVRPFWLCHSTSACWKLGVHRTLALRLFEQRHLTLVQAARLAAMTAPEFLDLLRDTGISAVDYPPDELTEEISAAR